MRLALAVLLAFGSVAHADELTFHGVVFGRGFAAEGQRSWIEGGFGRFVESGDGPGSRAEGARGQAHLGLDWKPHPVVLLHLHVLGRAEPSRAGGDPVGMAEAFLQYRPDLSTRVALRLRAGTMFPPTSRENVGPLWSSPYTLTFSMLNSWIGEEVRPTGLDAALIFKSSHGDELQLAGMALVGADTAGALLAWRGWAMGDRLSVHHEVLPLPPLVSLRTAFARQRTDGTRPLDELDGRVGWHARARWSRPKRAVLQAAYLDNRGDRELYRGQYSWATRQWQAGGQLDLGLFSLIGEALRGDTGMGPRGPGVDVRYETAYALATVGNGTVRVSARWDGFRVEDRDQNPEPDQEDGQAWTAAVLYWPHPHVRAGLEYVDLRATRAAAAFAGASPDTDSRRLMAELRVQF